MTDDSNLMRPMDTTIPEPFSSPDPPLYPSRIPMIECRGLSKSFGTLKAVDDLNLTIEAGELFGFLGPNGAGKTTSIKMMTGLLRPGAGTGIIGGHDIQVEPLKAKALFGYIPDNPFLYEKLTGREFVNFMADLYSVTTQERARKIDDLLRLFELYEKGGELIQGYSRNAAEDRPGGRSHPPTEGDLSG
jgi:ABC-2 type transport system ATP-binding protein